MKFSRPINGGEVIHIAELLYGKDCFHSISAEQFFVVSRIAHILADEAIPASKLGVVRMSGILEQIFAELVGIRTALGTLQGAQAPTALPPATQPAVQAQPDPFAPAPAVTNGSGQITEAAVMGLIEPHLDNAPLKAALSAVLAGMGIARLPEARPDQLPALYSAFQGVIAQHAAPAAATPTSII
jgi:hypothetical protein